jgi:hypothetical protein
MDLQKVILVFRWFSYRVLFSVWSPFVTDDPATIRILKKLNFLKGAGVTNRRIWQWGSGDKVI